MANYLIYTDEVVSMRVSCIEADAQAMATANGAFFILDTFEAYDLDQLEVVNRTIQVKSQERQESEATAELAYELRERRDLLLRESDWTQVSDAPLTEPQTLEWRTYRQALRDVPNQEGFPDNVVWPTEPT